jgi:hypothetical protein
MILAKNKTVLHRYKEDVELNMLPDKPMGKDPRTGKYTEFSLR